jgi:hypothetical protein
MLKPSKKCHGYWGLWVAEDSKLPLSHCSICQPSQSVCFRRMLFCGYHLRHSCETTIKTTGGDIMKKRCMEVQKSYICGKSFRCSSSKARFYCTGIFQPRWMIMWWGTELSFQQNVLLCDLTTARLRALRSQNTADAYSEISILISRRKLRRASSTLSIVRSNRNLPHRLLFTPFAPKFYFKF